MRQAELWLKYRFSCSCKRCGAVPTTYVDYALQARSADNPENPESSDDEIENLMQNFDDAITDYLSFGDSKSCCQKLEHLLRHGDLSDESLEPKEAKSPQKVKLHPFHQLSLNAYTTLASAYKVQASDLLALNYKLEAFNMYKTSSAYSLLLAGVANHLFMFEPAIVPTVASFWINAGESLLNLARSSLWVAFLKRELSRVELSSLLTLKCNGCCVVDTLEPNSDQKSQLYNCIANVTPNVWSLLSSESNFLKLIQNPVDLNWLGSPAALEISDAESVSSKQSSQLEVEFQVTLFAFDGKKRIQNCNELFPIFTSPNQACTVSGPPRAGRAHYTTSRLSVDGTVDQINDLCDHLPVLCNPADGPSDW